MFFPKESEGQRAENSAPALVSAFTISLKEINKGLKNKLYYHSPGSTSFAHSLQEILYESVQYRQPGMVQ